MAHVRQQIREAAAAALADVPGISAVYQSRVHPLAAGRIPALLVYTSEERSTLMISDPDEAQTLERRVDLVVECLTRGDEFDDDMDALAVAVETRIAGAAALKALCSTIALTASGASLDGRGERRTGALRLTFEATYWTLAADPETAILTASTF